MMTLDLFDSPQAAAPTPEPAPLPQEPSPAPLPAALPPLEPYSSADEALRAILEAFDFNGKPLYFKGFRVVTVPIADAIERARLTVNR